MLYWYHHQHLRHQTRVTHTIWVPTPNSVTPVLHVWCTIGGSNHAVLATCRYIIIHLTLINGLTPHIKVTLLCRIFSKGPFPIIKIWRITNPCNLQSQLLLYYDSSNFTKKPENGSDFKLITTEFNFCPHGCWFKCTYVHYFAAFTVWLLWRRGWICTYEMSCCLLIDAYLNHKIKLSIFGTDFSSKTYGSI